MTSCTLGDIADLVGGQLHGDPNLTILGANTIRESGPGEITLADDAKYADVLARSRAAAVVTNDSFHPSSHPHIVVADVRQAFAKIVSRFRPNPIQWPAGIHDKAVVDPTAQVDSSVHVGPGACIGPRSVIGADSIIHAGAVIAEGCQVGNKTILGANAVLYEHTVVGDRVIIHAGAVVGAYGFGYLSSEQGHALSPQLGNVIIEDDVEVGANSTIDRGTYGATVVGQGTKVDNLVQIAHNCRIGKHNMLCAQVGIAGSVMTGDFVVMAGQVGIRDHVDIGDNVRIGAKAGVKGTVPSGETMLGTPATPERLQMQLMISTQKLPELRRGFRDMQRQVRELESFVSQLKEAETGSPANSANENGAESKIPPAVDKSIRRAKGKARKPSDKEAA